MCFVLPSEVICLYILQNNVLIFLRLHEVMAIAARDLQVSVHTCLLKDKWFTIL